MIPHAPAIPASIAALVMIGGIALMYWSLVGLGLLTSGTPAVAGNAAPASTPQPPRPVGGSIA